MAAMKPAIKTITVQATVNAPAKKVWKCYTLPEHIVQWNNASPDWHTPRAQNNVRVGGRFLFRMETKDGSAGFDFGGVYEEVEAEKLIAYSIADGRNVRVTFAEAGAKTDVVVTFEAEKTNPVELQRAGWQSILDNFKKHVEAGR